MPMLLHIGEAVAYERCVMWLAEVDACPAWLGNSEPIGARIGCAKEGAHVAFGRG